MLPDLTPDEAFTGAGEVLEMTGLGNMGFVVGAESPEAFQAVMASLMLVMNDMMTSDCTCDSCVRVREIFSRIA